MSCHVTYVQNRTEQNMLYNMSSYVISHVMLCYLTYVLCYNMCRQVMLYNTSFYVI